VQVLVSEDFTRIRCDCAVLSTPVKVGFYLPVNFVCSTHVP
jgi:hypothetical protein